MYASLISRSEVCGAIVIGDDIDDILDSCLEWFRDSGLPPEEIGACLLHENGTHRLLGSIAFGEDQVACYLKPETE